MKKWKTNYMIMDDMKGSENILSLWKAIRNKIELLLMKTAYLLGKIALRL